MNSIDDRLSKLKSKIDKPKLTTLEIAKLKMNSDLCAICKKRFGKTIKMNLDHCHKTGDIREYLCSSCNTGLGCFKDRINYLQSAIDYLIRHRKGGF